jgi:hypothetical protein
MQIDKKVATMAVWTVSERLNNHLFWLFFTALAMDCGSWGQQSLAPGDAQSGQIAAGK